MQQTRLRDGSRKVTQITEVAGMEGDIIVLTDVFKFEQTGIGPDGKVAKRWDKVSIDGHVDEVMAAVHRHLPKPHDPFMDLVPAQGIRLTDFHVAPMCTPTRGQLLTGMDALHNGEFGKMVALRSEDIITINLEEAVLKNKKVDMELYEIAAVFF